MTSIRLILSTLAFALVSSAALAATSAPVAQPFSAETYAAQGSNKAVVIFSANWGKKRYCGDHDAVRLQSFAFDKAGGRAKRSKAPADFQLQADAGSPPPERFLPYAYILEPGEYHLSSFGIDTLNKTDDGEKLGRLSVTRKQLMKGKQYVGGKFTAAAGEVVYIGHFFLSCDSSTEPALLRYQIGEGEQYNKYLNYVLGNFKPIEAEQVKYRPFESEKYGAASKSE